jgi:hypothetical protein
VSVAPLRLLRGEWTPREVRLDSAVLQLDLAEFALRIEASELTTDWTGEAPALRGQAQLRALRLERPAAEPVLVESGVLSFVLDPESLRASLADGRLHGGEAGAEIHVRPTGEGALFEGELALSNVDVAPLLRRVFGVSDMTGRGSLSARLTSRGATRSALLGALNGGGAAQLATLRAKIGGGEPDAPFQRLDGTFRIEDGVLESRDLDLVGPHARTRGALTYDLRSGASRTAWRRSGAP